MHDTIKPIIRLAKTAFNRHTALTLLASGPIDEMLMAGKQGKWDVVLQTLDKHPGWINAQSKSGNSLLHYAMLQNNDKASEAARKILQRGAKTNLTNNNNDRPIHLAASNLDYDQACFLIDHGALVNCRNNQKLSPYDLANCRISRGKTRDTIRGKAQTACIVVKDGIKYHDFNQSLLDLLKPENDRLIKCSSRARLIPT